MNWLWTGLIRRLLVNRLSVNSTGGLGSQLEEMVGSG